MPELWGAPLPVWAIVIISLFLNPYFSNLARRILSVFGIVAKQNADERQYQRTRESEIFGVLKSLIEGNQAESKERDGVLKDQGKVLANLTMALHKNTDTVARLIDQIRILGYNAAVVDESLKEIKEHIETRRLRYEED
jgi:UDP-glucose 6-dehydrogenase